MQRTGRHPDAGKDWRHEEKGMMEHEKVGWQSPTRWTWVWASSWSWWWIGKPGVLQSMGHQESDMTEVLNWTEMSVISTLPDAIPCPSELVYSPGPGWVLCCAQVSMERLLAFLPTQMNTSQHQVPAQIPFSQKDPCDDSTQKCVLSSERSLQCLAYIVHWVILLFCHLKVKVKSLGCVWLFATPWTIAHQVPLSMGFSRQEYWSGLPFLSPWDFPDPGIEPRSLALQADAFTSEPPGKPYILSLI